MGSIREPFRFNAVLLLSAAVISGVTVISHHRPDLLQPLFGDVYPVGPVVLVCVAGVVALYLLHHYWGFAVYAPGRSGRGTVIAATAAIPFMIAATIADVSIRFPKDTNVEYPLALIFYPTMGFVAQIALHVVPLAATAAVCAVTFRSWPVARQLWLSFVLVSTIEAAFQVSVSARAAEQVPLTAFVAIHLFIFGLVELYIFRCYDFVSMFLFRLVYYGYWHIVWGFVRLQLLF